jgi:BirA family biotin operon repressor/biotin-[acetyl-CoA-carboxylase] ligase
VSSSEAGALAAALAVPLIHYDRVDSTMTEAERDPRAPAVHLADRQEAGQGRLGRGWSSPPGNLYATIAWPEGTASLPSAILAAIQVEWVEAIGTAGGPRTRCKWPNDGLVEGRKWAGLLARRVEGARGASRLLVGLGANLERAPEAHELDPEATPAAALAEHWRPWPGREAVIRLLLEAALRVLREGAEGIAERLALWPRHDALELGASLRVEDSDGHRFGRYQGLAPDGRLRLVTDQGEILLAAGEARRVRPPA